MGSGGLIPSSPRCFGNSRLRNCHTSASLYGVCVQEHFRASGSALSTAGPSRRQPPLERIFLSFPLEHILVSASQAFAWHWPASLLLSLKPTSSGRGTAAGHSSQCTDSSESEVLLLHLRLPKLLRYLWKGVCAFDIHIPRWHCWWVLHVCHEGWNKWLVILEMCVRMSSLAWLFNLLLLRALLLTLQDYPVLLLKCSPSVFHPDPSQNLSDCYTAEPRSSLFSKCHATLSERASLVLITLH